MKPHADDCKCPDCLRSATQELLVCLVLFAGCVLFAYAATQGWLP